MRILFFILALSLSYPTNLFSQLRKNVMATYQFDEKGVKHKITEQHAYFNKQGRPVKSARKDFEGVQIKSRSTFATTYHSNGTKKEETFITMGKGMTKHKYHTVYSYPQADVVEAMQNKRLKTISSYNADKTLKKVQVYLSTRPYHNTTYQYDTKARLLRCESAYVSDSLADYTLEVIEYMDSLHQKMLTRKTIFGSDTSLYNELSYLNMDGTTAKTINLSTEEYTLYLYNAKRDLIRIDVFSKEGKKLYVTDIAITYWH